MCILSYCRQQYNMITMQASSVTVIFHMANWIICSGWTCFSQFRSLINIVFQKKGTYQECKECKYRYQEHKAIITPIEDSLVNGCWCTISVWESEVVNLAIDWDRPCNHAAVGVYYAPENMTLELTYTPKNTHTREGPHITGLHLRISFLCCTF